MARVDRKVLQLVARDWVRATGCGITDTTLLGMLMKLEKAYGDRFLVSMACQALDTLAKNARVIKKELKRQYREARA